MEGHCVIKTPHLLKQSKPGHHLADITIDKFKKNKCLCVVATLKEYINRTSELRGSENKLLISTQKPHKGVHKSTVSRWVKTAMLCAGVEKQFTAHSTRSASTSKAILSGIPLDTILKTAGWANAQTFQKFYHRQVTKSKSFQQAIQIL
jgi:integrase